ncbi:primosomal protein N' [Pasteurellaceae bacterium HPA106]|uniref:primosomal protein N' n=1 Tax=Spirabiliibacterium pneumoniae TaxID=221400 RepID=UPI001AADA1FB|nr:primosomal protein N' [Spirabiliibacterium pneumoniae]MBE2897263.1 primosomal protein N' [Spirabiliibacterium pneumoniae]
MTTFVRAVLALPLAKTFDYLAPADQTIAVGARVRVPFGRQHRIAIVVDLPTESPLPKEKLKPILEVLDHHSIFTPEMDSLLEWAARYYHAGLGDVLFQALPTKLRTGEADEMAPSYVYRLTPAGETALLHNTLSRAPKQKAFLECLSQAPEHTILAEDVRENSALLRALQEKKLIEKRVQQSVFTPWQDALDTVWVASDNKPYLNKQQALALNAMAMAKDHHTWLLDGITGSGKTEVYLQMMEEVLKQGKQVLFLVPEIGLTPQLVRSVEQRFHLPIDVLHSNLTDRQRFAAWKRAKCGASAIVIGTRSALFTQFQTLGLIIVDEEHDPSYKQQDTQWRYHARDMAVVRARKANIPIILGSATPSLESLANVEKNKYRLLQLDRRAISAHNLSQHIINLKNQPLNAGISARLESLMREHLERGNQVLLFLNRRGYAPVMLCHECGWLAECQQCERPYTYHQTQHHLRCHHCGIQRPIPRQCPKCGSTHLVTTGIGTEQLEQQLKQRFPAFSAVRIDRDSTARKGSLEAHLKTIEQKKSQILIGTQMLAKGHHFPDVTLVALLNIDGALFSQDFRSEERLAQLYVQVAGRAGRGLQAGEVVLQTHFPHHPLLSTLLDKGYRAFAKQALQLRAQLGLPPYAGQALFKVRSKNSESAVSYLDMLAQTIRDYGAQHHIPALQILGPIEGLMAKKAGFYHWQLLLQHPSKSLLQRLLTALAQKMLAQASHLQCILDIDPIDFS